MRRCVSPSHSPVRESDVLGLKHRRAFERLLGAGSGLTTPRDRTRVLSCSAPPGQSTLASAWIGLPARTLTASAPVFRFGSAPFRAALQIRLGLPVTAVAGRARCRCGHLADPYGHHALSCNHDGMTFRRHQAVLRALERLYAWTNITTSRNLHNYFPHLHSGDPGLRVLRADLKAEAHPSPDETTVIDVAVVHCTSDARTRIGTAAGHLHGRVRMAAADATACGKRDRLDRHMAAAAPVGAPAGTRFLPLVFEVHGGCTGDTAREIRHLLNAWSEQNGYDETRCAVNRHAWRYYNACMLAHAVQAQVRWLAEPMAASG